MSKPSQRKREKQRKREAKRKQRRSEPVALAYSGKKYRTDALIPFHFATETAIYDCFVMTRRKLTDHHVRAALEELIAELRHGPLPEWNVEHAAGAGRRRRGRFPDRQHPPPLAQIISIPTRIRAATTSSACSARSSPRSKRWGSISPQSRGYLEYIEEFCKKMGYMAAPMEMPPEIEEDPEPRPPVFSSFFP